MIQTARHIIASTQLPRVAPVDFKMYHKADLTQSSINKVIDEYNYLLAKGGLVPPSPP